MGKHFLFPNCFILAIGYIRYSFHLPYKQIEGIIKATGKSLPSKTSYGHICKRINRQDINITHGNTDEKYGKRDDDKNIAVYLFERL